MKKTLASSIGALMEKNGLNIAELAQMLSVPKATLHKIVTGKSARPRSKTLTAISDYFKIPIVKLLHGDIEEYTQQEKIKNIPLIDWDSIHKWLDGKIEKEYFQQTTPTNLNISEKSFALVSNDMSSTLFKSNSILVFDPMLEVKDGIYVLVKLEEHPDILFRQIVCDASNAKYLKSLNQEFSTNVKKLSQNDQIIAILVMAKTLFYHK